MGIIRRTARPAKHSFAIVRGEMLIQQPLCLPYNIKQNKIKQSRAYALLRLTKVRLALQR